MKHLLKSAGGTAGLTIVHLLGIILSGMIIALFTGAMPGGDQGDDPSAGIALIAMCALNSMVLFMIARRSLSSGLKLSMWLFIAFWGTATFMSMIESLFFLEVPGPAETLTIMVMQAISCSIVCLSAPFLAGRRSGERVSGGGYTMPDLNTRQIAIRVLAIALIYVPIYWVFGYYIPWQDEAVRAFYGASELKPFVTHLVDGMTGDSNLVLFQYLRGIMWAGITYVIAWQLSGKAPLYASLLTGLALAVWMGTALLLPNPFMPEHVRTLHLWEVLSSNFLFGILACNAWLKPPKEKSAEAELVKA